MITVKNISELLVEFGAAVAPFEVKDLTSQPRKIETRPGYGIGEETYGRRSCLYIETPSAEDRHRLEAFLESKGATVNRSYWPESRTVEAQVRWFKGQGWNH